MHLLATKSVTLDEADSAVDLGQTPAEVVVLSFSDSDLSAAAEAWRRNEGKLPTLRLASLKHLKHPLSVDLYIERVVAGARAVVVRCLGGLDYWRYGFERLASVAREKGILFVALPGDDRADPRLTALSTVEPGAVGLLDRYFREGGADNLGEALSFVAHLLGRSASWSAPRPMGAAIAMARDGTALRVADLANEDGEGGVALIVFYRASLLAADTMPITALMEALESQGLASLAVAVTSLKDRQASAEVEALIASRRPSIILNATAFSAQRDDGTTVLDAAGVPVLQVVLAGATREAWEASPRGLGPSDLAMNVVLPELDGRLLTRPISFKAERAAEPRLEHATTNHEPRPDRIDFVARLAAAWVRLGRKPASERRLALILSDYPQRGGRTGYAVGLDTSASVEEIVRLLAAQGYDIGGADVSAAAFTALLSIKEVTPRPTQPTSSRPRIEVRGKLRPGSTTPNRAGVAACVGPDLRRDDDSGCGADRREIYVVLEDYRRWLSLLPVAVQRGIEGAWGEPEADPAFADGSFRFPCLRAGKVLIIVQPDRGSASDRKAGYHDTASPPRHSYVALYAWLREAACIDAMIHLGTHGTLEWLPGKAVALSASCFPEAVLGPVPVVYPFIVNNPGEAVQAKRRLGAVTIGHLTPPLKEAGLHGSLADLEGLIEEYAEADGIDRRRMGLLEAEILERAWRSGLAQDCGVTETDSPRVAINKLDAQLCDIKELLIRDRLHVFGRMPDEECRSDFGRAIAAAGAGVTAGQIDTALAECAERERAALLAALDGRRVAPGPSGAPSRGRFDVLPTGRNLTTVDPRAIPTRTASVIGARAAAEVVKRHLQDHGDYPRALILDLWASASLRTGGDDLAQALAYLGVRPVWDPGSYRVTGVEVTPQAKLERPRIDVTACISGLFRDIFPAQIALFEMAVRLVADLEEDEHWNPLAEARRRGDCLSRIFGGAPGTYGAGAAGVALDGVWASREELGAAYLTATSYTFGRDDRGVPASESFRARVVAADALVHTQDDRERDILDGDGVADFAGGFAAAAAMLGRTPVLYHLDTSRSEAPRVRTIAEEIARVVRGRLCNPRWIAGMLSHGHRGVAEIAQGVDALFAFATTANAVPGHLFDAVHEALLKDDMTAKAMMSGNPAAADAVARRLEDAIARGLWTPRRNAVRSELERVRQGTSGTNPGVEAAQ